MAVKYLRGISLCLPVVCLHFEKGFIPLKKFGELDPIIKAILEIGDYFDGFISPKIVNSILFFGEKVSNAILRNLCERYQLLEVINENYKLNYEKIINSTRLIDKPMIEAGDIGPFYRITDKGREFLETGLSYRLINVKKDVCFILFLDYSNDIKFIYCGLKDNYKTNTKDKKSIENKINLAFKEFIMGNRNEDVILSSEIDIDSLKERFKVYLDENNDFLQTYSIYCNEARRKKPFEVLFNAILKDHHMSFEIKDFKVWGKKFRLDKYELNEDLKQFYNEDLTNFLRMLINETLDGLNIEIQKEEDLFSMLLESILLRIFNINRLSVDKLVLNTHNNYLTLYVYEEMLKILESNQEPKKELRAEIDIDENKKITIKIKNIQKILGEGESGFKLVNDEDIIELRVIISFNYTFKDKENKQQIGYASLNIIYRVKPIPRGRDYQIRHFDKKLRDKIVDLDDPCKFNEEEIYKLIDEIYEDVQKSWGVFDFSVIEYKGSFNLENFLNEHNLRYMRFYMYAKRDLKLSLGDNKTEEGEEE